jgi:hypothetical protein
MIGIINCLFGKHKVRRGTVTDGDNGLVGHCRYCKTGLIRKGHGDWIVGPKSIDS